VKRPTIGVLIGQLDGKYQSPIFKAISKKAIDLDVNLIFLTGKTPDSPINFEKNENVIYELGNSPLLDGLIFVSGNLSNFLTYNEFLAFFNNFKKKAKVSISIPIKGFPSIVIKNRKAMKEMVSHLIKEHGYKKIAFISGPENHPEAIQRFAGYKEALIENGIEVNENLILPGNFNIESGYTAVRILIDERNIIPQAIVGANDTMALSAFSELKRRGFIIPKDIAITGFDNQEDIQLTEPPITTVMQPLEEEGSLALDLVIKMINGEKVPEIVELDCKILIRQSCGCLGIPLIEENFVSLEGDRFSFFKSLINNYRMDKDFPTKYKKEIEHFIGLTLDYIENPEKQKEFLYGLSFEISRLNGDEVYLNEMYNFFDYLAHHSREREELTVFYNTFHKALYLINLAFRRIDGRRRLELEWTLLRLAWITESIFSVTTLDELKEKIYQVFAQFNFIFFYLIFFKTPPVKMSKIKWKLPSRSIVECKYQRKSFNLCKTSESSREFRTSELLPSESLPEERFSLAVMCLYHMENIFGYMIMEVDYRISELVYVYLQQIISLSLRILTLWEQQRKSRRELEKFNIKLKEMAERDALTGLYNRRGFFELGEKIIQSAREKRLTLGVFFIDLDNLKLINDRFGHIEGDEALKSTAFILKNCFRRSDLIARVGGDEFVVIAINSKMENNFEELLITRLYNLLHKYNLTSNKEYVLSFSVGYSTFNPQEITTLEHIITVVDEKLYREKQRKKSFR